MRLRLERHLATTTEGAWAYLTVPELHNSWSLATVHTLLPGDGGLPNSVGALRRVAVPARPRPAVFDEVIEHADYPHRFVYRVVGQRLVRHHQGVITFTPEVGGTRVTWEVAYDFAFGGMDGLMRRVVAPQLERSLDDLTALVLATTNEQTTFAPPPARRSITDEHEVEVALADAEAIRAEQEALADRLEQQSDPRHWFARVYQYVTDAMIEACGPGSTVTHRAWTLRLVPRFHRYYLDNLARADGELDGPAEPHWATAFAAIENAATSGSSMAFWSGLIEGAKAHIEGDLPRVLADVYLTFELGRCDYQRFRADFLLMAPLFGKAFDRLSARVPRAWFPAPVRLTQRFVPPEVTEAFLARKFFDPVRERRASFERGRELVEFVLSRNASVT